MSKVLAMYDFRGKQKYIYRTNRIKEIVGASLIIRDGYKELYNVASRVGVEILKQGTFSKDNPFQNGNYQGAVVYEGGGNLFVLYDSEESCLKVNKAFTKWLEEKTYSLKAICTYIPVDLDENDWDGDRRRLYKKHAEAESREIVPEKANTLPFIQVDRKTSLPLLHYDPISKEKKSAESMHKLGKYKNELDNDESIKLLDEYVTKKGEESLLAIVYIDGNRIGDRVKNYMSQGSGYDESVARARKFSRIIDELCVQKGLEAVDDALKKTAEMSNLKRSNKAQFKYRKIVAAGDEITIVCNARYAYKIAVEYLKKLKENQEDSDIKAVLGNDEFTACAGIAIFHSHAPFADAYRIAEECCEEAKKKSYEHPGTSWLSFHYCQTGINSSLELIRELEGVDKVSRPWCIENENMIDDKNKKEVVKRSDIETLDSQIGKYISRTNIKSLLEGAYNDDTSFNRELERIKAHSEFKGIEDVDLNKDMLRHLVYDYISMYDLWFREEV